MEAHIRRVIAQRATADAEAALEAAANISVSYEEDPDAASASGSAPPGVTGCSTSPVIEVLGQVTLATIKHAAAMLTGAATGSAGSIPPRVYMPASDGVIEEWLRFEGGSGGAQALARLANAQAMRYVKHKLDAFNAEARRGRTAAGVSGERHWRFRDECAATAWFASFERKWRRCSSDDHQEV